MQHELDRRKQIAKDIAAYEEELKSLGLLKSEALRYHDPIAELEPEDLKQGYSRAEPKSFNELADKFMSGGQE
jgi:hypothetical protein